MGFTNEFIPEEDKRNHNINPSSNFYLAGVTSWTVDRDRDMFLLQRTGGGPESTPGVTRWAFYWRGHLLDVQLQLVANGGDKHGGHGWAHFKLLSIGGIPPQQDSLRKEVGNDLKDALTAHRGLGVYSTRTSYEVTLDGLSER